MRTNDRKIRFGPYFPPYVEVGDEIQCKIHGRVTVAEWSDLGKIFWPRCSTSRNPALIVVGDLIRAMASEAVPAVADMWGVSLHTVSKWKRELKLPKVTAGTREVRSENESERAAQRPKSKPLKAMLAASIKLRTINEEGISTSRNFGRITEILEMRAKGLRLGEIGKAFGISKQAVWEAIKKSTARHDLKKNNGYLGKRCDCGQYVLQYVKKIGHRCTTQKGRTRRLMPTKSVSSQAKRRSSVQ